MNLRLLLCSGMMASAVAFAASPSDYASRWTLSSSEPGAYAVVLDDAIYREVTRPDLSDLAAFNADGGELAFGPLPAADATPPHRWKDGVWFALPAHPEGRTDDLQLHVRRGADGSLSLDSTLAAAAPSATTSTTAVSELLVDVRDPKRPIDAIAFDFEDTGPDISTVADIEASDDLQSWHTVVAGAPLARFRQGGQSLLRRTIELQAQPATYLSVRLGNPTPVVAVHLLMREPGDQPARASLEARLLRREGRAFVYGLPARVAVERLSVALADDNAVAHVAVASRDAGDSDWRPVGGYTAFRLRGQGVMLDAEPMELDASRASEWRIEPDGDLPRAPRLRFDYQPETWMVVTQGRAPYVLVAGSRRATRADAPIPILVGQLRTHYGAQWRPPVIAHGPTEASAGAAALTGWDATARRTWLLWGVLGLGAAVVMFMVVRLLQPERKPTE